MLPVGQVQLGGWTVDAWTLLGRLPALLVLLALAGAGLRRGWGLRGALLSSAALASGLSLGVLLLPGVHGALAGGLLAWAAAQRLLGLRDPPLATLALALTLLLAVGRVGCLLAGCCFGAPTALPWAVHYGPGSFAWLLHAHLGRIAADAPRSLGVHPVQLYESAALLLWVPALLALRRRWRSEAALLWLTAALDLGLRAGLDGLREMVNASWTLAGSLGPGRYQAGLAAASALCLFAALALELRARAAGAPAAPEPAGPGAAAGWAVFAAAAAAGVATDAVQTPFLHLLLLGSLAAAVPALRLPRLPALPGLPAWAGPALAALLLVPVAAHRGAAADPEDGSHVNDLAGPPDRGAAGSRRWIYEVDHRRGMLLRIGSSLDRPEEVDALRARLGLPGAPEPAPAAASSTAAEPRAAPPAIAVSSTPAGPPAPPLAVAGSSTAAEPQAPPLAVAASATPALPRDERARLWVGLEGAAGRARETSGSGCGGPTQVVDRSPNSGALRVEADLPLEGGQLLWLGGSAGRFSERVALSGPTSGTDTVEGWDGRLWAEVEWPGVTLGVAAMAARTDSNAARATTQGAAPLSGQGSEWIVLPGGHVRIGARAFALDLGFLDRHTVVAPPGGHFGFSGTLGSHGDPRLLAARDGVVRYWVGAQLAPGLHGFSRLHPGLGVGVTSLGFGLGLEVSPSPRFALGFDALGGPGLSAGAWARVALWE